MDQREDQKEEEPVSETKDQSKAQSNKPEDDCKHGRKHEPSAESWRSNLSKDQGIDFKSDHPSATERLKLISEAPSGQSAQQHQQELDSIFMELKGNIITFVENELQKIQMVLGSDYPEGLEGNKEDDEALEGEDKEQMKKSREELLFF
ncbi:hypothetical protein XENORESO_005478 [Xenotaenia resolanae]|uniref:Uncharacterized protein n=1 Tax=Xenotaenia resolanae TaxID=208358 RepID=A0ABV0W2U0_9TELE